MRKNRGTAEDFDSFRWIIIWYFYKTDDETEIVYVVRIMYGGRDIHKQLSQTEDVSVN